MTSRVHTNPTVAEWDDGTEVNKLRDAHAQMAEALGQMKSKNDVLSGEVYVSRAKIGAAKQLVRLAVTTSLCLAGALLLAIVVIVLLVKR